MKNTIWIVDIEPLDNRYTKQWQTWIPELCHKLIGDKYKVFNIAGKSEGYTKPQKGAFFNFAATCEYKASQAVKIAQLFDQGMVKDGDIFFFTDAWNQTVHSVVYMSELLGIKVKLAGIWHAGWYDPTDILGVKIQNTSWVSEFEQSTYHAYDLNFFGTQQHFDKFNDRYDVAHYHTHMIAGYPLEYIANLKNDKLKENIVVFPHRLNDDKAPHVFDAIRDYVRDVKQRTDILFFKTQEQDLSKDGYYDFLKRCKVVFSANKHENLGIGTFEAMTAGCLPLVPNKLSYEEMYCEAFKYRLGDDKLYACDPHSIAYLGEEIIEMIDNYRHFKRVREVNTDEIQEKFFDGTRMIKALGDL